jgi:hypothetical protein
LDDAGYMVRRFSQSRRLDKGIDEVIRTKNETGKLFFNNGLIDMEAVLLMAILKEN